MEDVLANYSTKRTILDAGYVELLDVAPRLVRPGRTVEDAIVRAARVSTKMELKSPLADQQLVEYLMRNRHTSPLEQVSFTFRLRVPKFVSIQLLRHRTAKLNEESQRYSPVTEDYYHPSLCPESLRGQVSLNQQSSATLTDQAQRDKIRSILLETEELLDKVYSQYEKLLLAGLTREVARFCLPVATYTTMIYTLDLHNFLHFTGLRDEPHTQHETRVVAGTMWSLVSPLVPTVARVFEDMRGGLHLSALEVEALREGRDLETGSRSQREAFRDKRRRLVREEVRSSTERDRSDVEHLTKTVDMEEGGISS